jgi:2,3-bisphosphoglycerate-independent phosphoglycerate mutase
VKASYEKNITDEFVEPRTIVRDGLIRDGDAVVFFNFRADRARQITEKLIAQLKLTYVMMTQYDAKFGLPYAFGPETHQNILGEVVSAHGLTNLRVAETEKYPHVTYFFNGGREQAFAGEEREMIASPKVATYDLQPEMSAPQVCDVVVKAVNQRDFDLIVVNFANPDMVGHTGVFEAAVKAVETCDACLARIWDAIREHPYTWLVTADHGNSETMVDPETGLVHTYHTTNPVPFICIDEDRRPLRSGGSLRDIAPTILGVLGREAPREMTGRDLRIF